MTKRRRLMWSAAILAAIVTVVLGVLAMLPAQPGVTKANFDRIEIGMFSDEVELILGEPMQPHMRELNTNDRDIWRDSDGSTVRIDYFRDSVTKNAGLTQPKPSPTRSVAGYAFRSELRFSQPKYVASGNCVAKPME
jgi:hypothetical protein